MIKGMIRSKKTQLSLLGLFSLVALFSCSKKQISANQAYEIAKKAYIYTYPMVENYLTLYQYAVDKDNPEYKGPLNTINNVPRVYTPKDKGFVTPNSDTPYSHLFMDLRAEPLVVSLPEINQSRYYSLQIIDLYTQNIDYIGTRVDGNSGGNFLLSGPNWKGKIPKDIKRVIQIPTELGYVLFRTQLFDLTDLENVKRIQSEYKVQPLSSFLKTKPIKTEPINFPKIDRYLIDQNYWNYVNFLLQFAPPLSGEKDIRENFKKIGLTGNGEIWDRNAFSTEILNAIEKGRKDGNQEIKAGMMKLTDSANLFGSPEKMKGKYFERAMGAMGGIYGNSIEETLYPVFSVDSEGKKLDPIHYNYTLTFEKGKLPPVEGFWSLTMYDNETRLLVENPINRYLINSPMLPNLKFNEDGSLTIYIQHDRPNESLISNWLPAPNREMMIVMRLYLPKKEILDGSWKIPKPIRHEK